MPSNRAFLAVALILSTVACGKDPAVAKVQHLKSGDDYAAAGKLPEAIVEYKNAIKDDSLFGEAHAKLADALSKSGKGQEAYLEYIRAADLLPADIDAQIKAGAMLLLAGQFEDAQTRADKALALNPGNVDAYLLRGRALAGLKNIDAAIAQVNSAMKIDPTRSLAYSDLAVLQMAQNNPQKAEQAFKHAVELAPTSPDARVALANFYWLTGKSDLAEQVLKEALAIAPSDVSVNRQLAYFYVSMNRGPEAEAPLKFLSEHKDPNAQLLLAEYYRASGRQPLALQVLDQVATDPAMFAVARARKGAILYASGQKKEGYDIVEEILKKDPKNSVGLIQKASFLLADHDLDQALKLAQTAAANDPESVTAPIAIGRIQTARGEIDEAISAYNDALKLAPKYLPVQLELARLNLTAGRPSDALLYAANVLAAQPRNADAIMFKARALMMQGNVVAADEPMKLLATSFPNSPSVQAQLGTLYFQKHDLSGARAAYERALKGDPVNFEALNELTALDFSEKKGETARARIDAVLASRPNAMPPLQLLAARIYNTQGDHTKAELTVSRVLEQDPSNLDAYLFLAQLYASQKRLDEAIAKFEELAKRKPKLVVAPTQIGILLELSNRRQEAAKWYEQALAIDKQAAVAANNLAMIYADTDQNLDVAGQLAQTAKQQLPNSPEVSDTLGWIYYKKGLGALAVTALKQAVAQQPQNAVYHYHLGLAYAKTGARAQARNSLEQALKISPSFDGADDARKVLKALQG